MTSLRRMDYTLKPKDLNNLSLDQLEGMLETYKDKEKHMKLIKPIFMKHFIKTAELNDKQKQKFREYLFGELKRLGPVNFKIVSIMMPD